MSIYRHIPAPPLNQYVDFCWYYVDLSPDHNREHVLPDGTFELIVNLQETPRKLFHGADSSDYDAFKRGWISGAHAKFLVIDALPQSSMIGVHFKPGGAAALLGMPADELAGQVVELDAVWGDAVWDWRDRLLAARTPDSKFRILERLLSYRLAQRKLRQRRGDAVAWALGRCMAEPDLRRLLLSQADWGLATNTLLTCSGDKPVCRQKCFAVFAGFRRYCSRFKHAQR
jgi:hypothetical protein